MFAQHRERWSYSGVSTVISIWLQASPSAVKKQGGVWSFPARRHQRDPGCQAGPSGGKKRLGISERKAKSGGERDFFSTAQAGRFRECVHSDKGGPSARKASSVYLRGLCASCYKANIESASACSVLIAFVNPEAWKGIGNKNTRRTFKAIGNVKSSKMKPHDFNSNTCGLFPNTAGWV